MATTSNGVDLPEEVAVEIMSWLPPESLIQFKCVGKSSYTLIKAPMNDPIFVAKHLHNMSNNNISSATSLALICEGPCTCEDSEPNHSPPCYEYQLFYLLTLFHDDDESDRIHHITKDFNLPLIPGLGD
ncbi:hypothetical protein TIFTF001_003911 [Ficus carica]|uniref:F-box domain-containing protein n=1 Tax=Ficus carica TaxID=3494 RepID=A0AA87ZJ51_FICCA|nr:hypothetical protein TIFTF001_003911 [Ficus carica]